MTLLTKPKKKKKKKEKREDTGERGRDAIVHRLLHRCRKTERAAQRTAPSTERHGHRATLDPSREPLPYRGEGHRVTARAARPPKGWATRHDPKPRHDARHRKSTDARDRGLERRPSIPAVLVGVRRARPPLYRPRKIPERGGGQSHAPRGAAPRQRLSPRGPRTAPAPDPVPGCETPGALKWGEPTHDIASENLDNPCLPYRQSVPTLRGGHTPAGADCFTRFGTPMGRGSLRAFGPPLANPTHTHGARQPNA